MQKSMDRRGVLKAALGVAGAAAAVSVIGAAPAAGAVTEAASRRGRDDIPDVPGMVGDRRANAFWYDYDDRFYFNPTPELSEAVGSIVEPMGGFTEVYNNWLEHYQGGAYPGSFKTQMLQHQDALQLISDEQRIIYDRYYKRDPRGLVFAFQEFGQGTLYDPRRPEGQKVKMMNYTPPNPTHAYHRWHPFLRAFQLTGIDTQWWTHVNRLAGAAWEIQSIAQPITDANDNPHLPKRQVRHITHKWLMRTPRQLDRAFETFPYPADMGH